MSNPRIPYQMASDRRRLPPPQPGKPLIVHVVVNVEYWPFDQPMPRKLLPGPHGNDKIPDVPNFSWVEYGMRTGFPRIGGTASVARRVGGWPDRMTQQPSGCCFPSDAAIAAKEAWSSRAHRA